MKKIIILASSVIAEEKRSWISSAFTTFWKLREIWKKLSKCGGSLGEILVGSVPVCVTVDLAGEDRRKLCVWRLKRMLGHGLWLVFGRGAGSTVEEKPFLPKQITEQKSQFAWRAEDTKPRPQAGYFWAEVLCWGWHESQLFYGQRGEIEHLTHIIVSGKTTIGPARESLYLPTITGNWSWRWKGDEENPFADYITSSCLFRESYGLGTSFSSELNTASLYFALREQSERCLSPASFIDTAKNRVSYEK